MVPWPRGRRPGAGTRTRSHVPACQPDSCNNSECHGQRLRLAGRPRPARRRRRPPTGVKAKKYADKIVKKELTQGKDEHALPSIAAGAALPPGAPAGVHTGPELPA